MSDLDQFVRVVGPSPQTIYEFLEEHPSFVCAANVEKLEEAVSSAPQANRHKLIVKAVMLGLCVTYTKDIFFEALQSDPPNSLCKEFEALLKQRLAM